VKILVIQTAFIGDVILATAVLEKLHQTHPQSKIDVLIRKGNESLFNDHPFLNEILIWNKKQQKIRNLFQLIARVRSNRYDTVINLHRFASSGMITALSGSGYTIGFTKNPLSFLFSKKFPHEIAVTTSDPYTHETDRNQLLIADLTDAEKARPKLYPSAADYEKVKSIQVKPYLCIAPASVWFTKQWTKEKWIELINQIPEAYTIYLLGAPADRELCNFIQQQSKKANVISVCGQLSFLESAALQKGAVMNFVNDSAPLHLASAMDAPVSAIFCSTMPRFGFGPLSTQSTVVETKFELPCKPCGLHGKKECPQGHFKCAVTIETADVLKVLTHSH
jgi:heptosyltransferase II